MLFLVFVALLVAFLVVLVFGKRFSLGAFCILAGVLGLAGCTAGGLLAHQDKPASLRLVPVDETAQAEVEIKPASFAETDDSSTSAWCQYLKEDSAAEATILRSPTLNGGVDDSGKLGVNLGVSISSFNKARLIEEAAQVKCRSHLAQESLQKRAVAAPVELTAAGYRAKSISILVRRDELAELREQIKYELRRGNITAEKAASLSGLIDEINLEGNAAKLQAARPMPIVVKAADASPFGEELIQAEAELDVINRKIRTADVVDVSISAGWNDLSLRDGFDTREDSFGGKVSVSFKLGAVAPQKFEHERLARDAKLKALQEQVKTPDGQVVAQQQALADLMQSQARLNETLADTIKLVKVLGSVSSPEFAGTFIAAKIQVVRLLVEKAAVDGSIDEIRQNMKRPKAG